MVKVKKHIALARPGARLELSKGGESHSDVFSIQTDKNENTVELRLSGNISV